MDKYEAGTEVRLLVFEGIIDSQSAKTAAASEERGYDGGKNERPEAAYSG